MNRKYCLEPHKLALAILLLITVGWLRAADANSQTQKFDVGGHKLTLVMRGRGGMPVVVEPGLGASPVESREWDAVSAVISRSNLICLYDRASSEPAAKVPRTSRDLAMELHKLLMEAKVPKPFVLVAHSIGGLNARVYANLYPTEVAALVLVDATHPDQDSGWLAALGKETAEESEAVTNTRSFLRSRIDHSSNNPEHLDVVASSQEVRAAGALGTKPLVVVTHSPNWKMVPNLPDDVSKKLEQVNQDLQRSMLALSLNSVQHVAKSAGHQIPREDPALIISAIQEVITKLEKSDK